MLGLDRGIAAGFYRRNERIGMPIVTVPGRRRQLRQEPTISVVCRAAHGFLRSTAVTLAVFFSALVGIGSGYYPARKAAYSQPRGRTLVQPETAKAHDHFLIA